MTSALDGIRLSATSISSWHHCQLQFRLANIDKVPEHEVEVFARGTAAHAAMEEWIRGDRRGPLPDLPDGDPICIDVVQLRELLDSADHVLVEWPWELQVAGERVTGRADVVVIRDKEDGRHVLILDWKTTLRAPGSDLDESAQVLLYGYAASTLLRADHVAFCFVALAHEHGHRVEWGFTVPAHVLVEKTAAEIRDAIESGKFSHNVTPECERCTRRLHCPAWRAAVDLGADPANRVNALSPMPELLIERQRLATLATIADEQRKLVDAWLRACIEPRESVGAGAWRARHAVRETPSLKASEAKAACYIAGLELDPDDIYSVKLSALRKALADSPDALAYIDAQASGHEIRYIEVRAVKGYEP